MINAAYLQTQNANWTLNWKGSWEREFIIEVFYTRVKETVVSVDSKWDVKQKMHYIVIKYNLLKL